MPIVSKEPSVELLAYTPEPFKTVVAAAKCCTEPKIKTVDDILLPIDCKDKDDLPKEVKQNVNIGRAIYRAGHHTLLEHVQFKFGLDNISRQLVWSLLHNYPFYDSSERSQRYVVFNEKNVFIPQEMQGNPLFEQAIDIAWTAYEELNELLYEYTLKILKDHRRKLWDKNDYGKERVKDMAKRAAIETARFTLPQNAYTGMTHTISGLSLLRLIQAATFGDVPEEATILMGKMVEAVREKDLFFIEQFMPELIPVEETLESMACKAYRVDRKANEEFRHIQKGYRSKLISVTLNGEQVLADSIRNVLSVSRDSMSDKDAIKYALDPSVNPYLLQSLNVSMHSPLMRSLEVINLTFAKTMSLSESAQNKRHRFSNTARPLLHRQIDTEPRYYTPDIIANNQHAKEVYDNAIKEIWSIRNKLIDNGNSVINANYLLPNATEFDAYENPTIGNWRHKMLARLCYKAQRPISKTAYEELAQVREIWPNIAEYITPKCVSRMRADVKPFCMEGAAGCKYQTWKHFPKFMRKL